ncbi:MAG: hypothetical protein WCX64_01575 [Candidatus Micrarchaeia archaeon]|jgi:hypothetical protein
MADDLYVAGFCFLVSVAAAAVAYHLSKKTHEAAVASVAELSARIESAHAESAAMTSDIQAAKSGLEKKITRNAMQSITKQAKDLTSAVIEGS